MQSGLSHLYGEVDIPCVNKMPIASCSPLQVCPASTCCAGKLQPKLLLASNKSSGVGVAAQLELDLSFKHFQQVCHV